jgi:N-acetylglucosaminyl-diphospho-decaprenol L-rhamnosyltransferase
LRPITASIVSHHQWSLLEPLLRQLAAHCHGVVERVVLTLNLPEQVTIDPAWQFEVKVLRNAAPAGFGANHNAAFAHCDTPWFLVMNPDIRLDRDVLSPMLYQVRSDAGLLTSRIQEPGKPQPEPYRSLLTPLELLRKRVAGHRPPPQPAWVAGMFMLVRRSAYEAVGGFDERFFMYCEDCDICARLRLANWQLQVVEEVTVLHEAQRASNSSLKPLAWHVASLCKWWASPAFWRYAALLRTERQRAATLT